MNIYSNYCITNIKNGKKYIGWTNKFPAIKRFHRHVTIANMGKVNKEFSAIHRAINKYGKESFTFEVIYETNILEDVKEMERFFIKKYGTFGKKGYNLTSGGDGCPDTKRWSKGLTKYTDDRLMIISKSRTGEGNPMYGKVGILWGKNKYNYDQCRRSSERMKHKNPSILGEDNHLAKQYKIHFKNGDLKVIKNLLNFSRQYGYQYQTLQKIRRGIVKTHKDIIGVEYEERI